MQTPTMFAPIPITLDTQALPAYLPVPGFGVLPANAFVIRAPQPVLVDTGLAATQEEFLQQLRSILPLEDLRWIWLTHADPDHTGSLERLLVEAPLARVVTTFLGMGKLNLARPIPPERVYLLNPGQRLDVGDRELLALRPPVYDAPETTGLFDTKTSALFSADCFGALLPEPTAYAAALSPQALKDGLVTWSSVDAPWLHHVEEAALYRSLDALRHLEPSVVLSAHLPPARGMTETLLRYLVSARSAAPFLGPDQAALQQMMAA